MIRYLILVLLLAISPILGIEDELEVILFLLALLESLDILNLPLLDIGKDPNK